MNRIPPTPDGTDGRRPGALTNVCVIAFVLALLALAGAVSALSFGGAHSMAWPGNLSPAGGETVHIQQQMIHDMMAALEPWQPWTSALAWINLAVASLLVAGGLLGMKMRAPGNRLLMVGLGSALLADGIGLPLGVYSQRAIMPVIENWIPQLMASTGDPNSLPGFQQAMEAGMRGSLLAGLVFGVIFGLAKMAFCGYGIWYLRRPMTRALFTNA